MLPKEKWWRRGFRHHPPQSKQSPKFRSYKEKWWRDCFYQSISNTSTTDGVLAKTAAQKVNHQWLLWFRE
jgi:hypothetical protein